MFEVLQEPICYGNVSGTSGADLLRRCWGYFRSRSVTALFAVLQEPICYGNVCGTAGTDLLGRYRFQTITLNTLSGLLGKTYCPKSYVGAAYNTTDN